MPTAYIYCRVSTGKQGELGLDSQKLACMSLWENKLKDQYPEVLVYEEQSVSAHSVDFKARPKAKEIGLRIQRGDCIIFAKLDRAFRSIRDTLNTIHYWKGIGVKVYCPDFGNDGDVDSLHGKIMLIGLSLAAEIEGDRIRQRMTDWSNSQRKHGRAVSNAQYGFKIVRHGEPIGYKKRPPAILQPNDAEQALVRWCYRQRHRGYSYLKLARHLNAQGYTTRNGQPWNASRLCKALKIITKVILAEKKLAAARKIDLRPWEFVTPDGALCKRIDVPEESKDHGA